MKIWRGYFAGWFLLFALIFGDRAVLATTRFVSAAGTNPISPFTSWATAATNIQDALSLSVILSGDVVLVTNGIYQFGGSTEYGGSNRVYTFVQNITIQSVNGPQYTLIEGVSGNSSVRCVYLSGQGDVLSGFTLTNGSTVSSEGGGLYCSGPYVIATNCIIVGNTAYAGGGASSGTLENCIIFDNSVTGVPSSDGGGVVDSTLVNCVISNNTSAEGNGGGEAYSTLTNCIIVGNAAYDYGGGDYSGILTNCTITNNIAQNGYGGGSAYSTLINCQMIGNIATNRNGGGGGGYSNIMINCAIIGNSGAAGPSGGAGGVFDCTLTNCLVALNSTTAPWGSGAYNCSIVSSTIESNFQGGAWLSDLTNCLLVGNSGGQGGGAGNSILNNCIVVDNIAGSGGGTWSGALYNCTVVGNTAKGVGAGGVNNGTSENCIIFGNYSGSAVANVSGAILKNCWTDPIFKNPSIGDYHLTSNSPCINAGDNAYVTTTNDYDGNPRIVRGTVDIGAYEYQNPSSVLSYAWAQQYGLPTDGSVDNADLDGSGFTVYQDWIAGLDPTNSASVLAMAPLAPTNNASGIKVSWQSISSINYFIQSSTNLSVQPAFSTIKSNIAGQAGTTSYTDTSATNNGPYFYRVGVQ